jgi:iron(III) transport system permease protein
MADQLASPTVLRARPARRSGFGMAGLIRGRTVVFLLLTALLLVLTVVPLATVVVGSFRPFGLPLSAGWTLDHYIKVWSDPYTYVLVSNTLLFALGSTALSIVVALALSLLIERTDLPGGRLFAAAILMPMVTPPLLLAIGWVLILSPRIGIVSLALQDLIGPAGAWLDVYTLPGMIFVQGLAMVPTAVLMFSPVVRNMDHTFEEAAVVSGASIWQTVCRVSLPFLLPTMLSIATILVIVGMLAFDVPAVIGMPGNIIVMSSEIFRFMNPPMGIPQYGLSAALNSSLFVFLLIGLVFYLRVTRHAARFATISGKGYKAVRFPLGRWRWPAFAFVVGYFLLAVILPFLALIWASLIPYFTGFDLSLVSKLSLASYIDIFTSERLWIATANSLLVAVTAAVGVTVLALAISWIILRSKVRFAWVLDVLSMIPIGVPHLMMAVALIFLFFSLRAIPIYGTIWLIALGHMIAYLPVASRMMQAGILQISNELEEAALTSGASVWQNIRRVVTPLLLPSIVALMIWMIVHSLREFSIAVMLQSGRNEVLSTILFSFWETGKAERAAAVAVSLMVCLGLLVAASGWLTSRRTVTT